MKRFSLSLVFSFLVLFMAGSSIYAEGGGAVTCASGADCTSSAITLSGGYVCNAVGSTSANPLVLSCCPVGQKINTTTYKCENVVTCPAWNSSDPRAGQDCGSTTHDTTFNCGPSNLYKCTCGPFGQCGTHSKVTSVTVPTSGTVPTQPAPGTTPVGSCDGCADSGTCNNFKKGTYTAASDSFHPECKPQGGYCSGTTVCGGGGTSTTPTSTGNLSCGEKCTSSSQCRNPSANGAGVACVNGTCQNTLCPAGQTIPGANCDCGSNTRKCGQTCSGAVGLCGPGQGTCTYVNPPQHWYTGLPDCAWGSTAYCVGTQNGFSKVTCTTGDAPGGQYARDPSGNVLHIDTSTLASSCQVCGNGQIEVGEQCDDGVLNGKVGSNCTAVTCKKVACNKACTTSADCGAVLHTVDVRFKATAAGQSMGFDYVLDNGTYYDGAPVTFGGGAASILSNGTAHGGTYLSTTVSGVGYFYKTYSSSIISRVLQGPTSGNLEIRVDGVLKRTVTDLRTGTGWTDITIPILPASQYTCVSNGTAKTCRLTSNPTSEICEVPPTPIPTASPLLCTLGVHWTSNANQNVWKIGDMITFSVDAVPAASIPAGSTIRYEGQVNAYRGTTPVSTVTLSPINSSASQFQPMAIQAVNATYYMRFRYCLKNAQNTESCSAWGAWSAPSTN